MFEKYMALFSSVPEKILYADFFSFLLFKNGERTVEEWKQKRREQISSHFKGIICSMWKYEENKKIEQKKCIMDSLSQEDNNRLN